MNARTRSQALVLASAGMFSTAGLFMGRLDMPIWDILFWRSVFAFVFTAMLIGAQQRPRSAVFFDCDAVLASLMSAAAMLFFIPALRLTSVANVAVIHAALPLLTTVLAFLISREVISRHTTVFCFLAAAGATVIFLGSSSSGLNVLGDSLALAMTTFMALMTIAFRCSKVQSVLAPVALSNAVCVIVAGSVADTLAVSFSDFCLLACFAFFQMTLGLVFFAKGVRRLPSVEAALLSLAEVPLSILWVWLAYGARPAWQTVVGGGLVLAAVMAHVAGSCSLIAHRSTPKGETNAE